MPLGLWPPGRVNESRFRASRGESFVISTADHGEEAHDDGTVISAAGDCRPPVRSNSFKPTGLAWTA
jgi:hypothetical protein